MYQIMRSKGAYWAGIRLKVTWDRHFRLNKLACRGQVWNFEVTCYRPTLHLQVPHSQSFYLWIKLLTHSEIAHHKPLQCMVQPSNLHPQDTLASNPPPSNSALLVLLTMVLVVEPEDKCSPHTSAMYGTTKKYPPTMDAQARQ